jgi:hypothetical protein
MNGRGVCKIQVVNTGNTELTDHKSHWYHCLIYMQRISKEVLFNTARRIQREELNEITYLNWCYCCRYSRCTGRVQLWWFQYPCRWNSNRIFFDSMRGGGYGLLESVRTTLTGSIYSCSFVFTGTLLAVMQWARRPLLI